MYVIIMSVLLQKVKIILLSQFLYLDDRDVCDHYVSTASESKNNFFKSVSFIYKIEIYVTITPVSLQKMKIIF